MRGFLRLKNMSNAITKEGVRSLRCEQDYAGKVKDLNDNTSTGDSYLYQMLRSFTLQEKSRQDYKG